MLLRTASSFSLFNANGDHILLPSSVRYSQGKHLVPCATKNSNNRPLTGVVFEPFEEVKKELDLVPTVPQASLARQKYTDESEATINEQIKCVPLLLPYLSLFFLFFLFSLQKIRLLIIVSFNFANFTIQSF